LYFLKKTRYQLIPTSLYLCCMQWFLTADWLRQENKKLNVQIISSGKMYCFESLVCRSTINACSASQMVMKVDTFFKQIFLPMWGNRSTQRKPTTFGSGLTHFNNPTPILQREIRFLTFTSLKYLRCFLCYLGIYRKPVIGETYSDIMKWTNIWQFPLLAGHCHSTSNTCNK
jgi:hypothetical protein